MRVYENGAFLCGDLEPTTASAVVVGGGLIRFSGTVQECREFAGPRADRVDLAGRVIIPGFIDSHVHGMQLAQQSTAVDLSAADSADSVVKLLGAELALRESTRKPHDSWLFGARWSTQNWVIPTEPTRHILDSVSLSTPIALHHKDLHTYWMNSAGLRMLSITASTPDLPGAYIPRDGDGSPRGIVGEAAAFAAERYFAENVAVPDHHSMATTLNRLVSQGITTVHDIDGLDALSIYQTLHAAGSLPLGIHKVMPSAALSELIADGYVSGTGDRWLNFGGIKIFGDGSLSSGTCSMHEPLLGSSSDDGVSATAESEIVALVARANAARIAVAIHAIGDRAVTQALDAMTPAPQEQGPPPSIPNRIEHLQHAQSDDLRRLRELGVVSCMQPSSCTSDIELVDSLLGSRNIRSYAWRSVLSHGASLAFSSDAPVEVSNPFEGIYAAITRSRPDGTRSANDHPDENLSREEAFCAYTSDSARPLTAGRSRNRWMIGTAADAIVLDRDPRAVDDAALRGTQIIHTIVDGDIRWTHTDA